MAKKISSLGHWIAEKGGRHAVAELLDVHESAIRHWLRLRNFPRPEQMAKIRKLSKGKVSFDEVIDHHFGKN